MKFVSVFMVALLASQAKAQETTTASDISITTEFDIVCARKIVSLLDCITLYVRTSYMGAPGHLGGVGSDPDPPCSTGCMFLITSTHRRVSLLIVSLFWIVRFSCSVNSIVVTTILLTLHENRTIQNKLTTRSVPDPPVRAGDEKHTSSAARWVWVRD